MSKTFKALIDWSAEQYSYLPWRKQRSLYHTLVSEIMLQQTTVGTVLNHFERFIKIYPDIKSLANATEEEICIAWKGLGYYRRARNLRHLAIQINDKFNGIIPTDLETLMQLKGIGPYTANAIIAIGADQRGLAVDANLERVLARFYGYPVVKGLKLQKKILQDFTDLKIIKNIDQLGARAVNEALMDLGRIICQARKASCSLCPLKKDCHAHQSGSELLYPRSDEKEKTEDLFIKLLRVVVKEKRQFLFYQKAENEWLSGQWELPTFILETNDEKLKQYPRLKTRKQFKDAMVLKSGITKYSIENLIVEMELEEFEKISAESNCQYQFKAVTENLNLSTASIKALKKIN